MKYKVKLTSLIAALVMVFGAGVFFINEINAQDKEYKIGDKGPGGGLVFYDKGNSSNGWRYLEAAPKDQSAKAEWGCYKKSIPGAKGTDIGTGKENTNAIIKDCKGKKSAAEIAASYKGGGKKDWFLPSKDEITELYGKLRMKGIGGLTDGEYWSSSEFSADGAWLRNFDFGAPSPNKKNKKVYVRAVRAF